MANLSEDVMDDIKERFEIYDKVGDNKVDAAQVINVLRALGQNPLTADVEKVIQEQGLAGTRVDIPTFAPIYSQMLEAPNCATHADMIEMMKTFDKEGNGQISATQFRQLLQHLGDKMTADQAEAVIAKHEDSNGMIAYDQWIRFLMNV